MSLSAFLAQNARGVEHQKFAASPRFAGADGKPVEWELRCVTGAEDEALRRQSVITRPAPERGRGAPPVREVDFDQYLGRLAAACTVYPDLNDRELQDSYRVLGADALLKAMLTPGEYAAYLARVQEICGFDTPFQQEVEAAKN